MQKLALPLTAGILLVVAALFSAAPSAAQESVSLVIEVTEDSAECGDDRTWCFTVAEGDLADVEPGSEVTITFRNTGQSPHQLDVSTLADADPEHKNTRSDDAIANTTAGMSPGSEETITFTAPEDAEGLYYWCGVSGHEQLGMWLEAAYGAEEEDDGGAGEASAPGALAFLSLLGLAFMALRRRD